MNVLFLERSNKLLTFTIVIFVFGDLLRKIALYFDFSFNRYTGVFKAIVFLSYIIFIGLYLEEYYKQKEVKKLIKFFCVLIIVFVIGQFLIKTSLNETLLDSFRGNLVFLVRYLFWPLTVIVFFPLINSNRYSKLNLRIIIYVFFINIIFIILGHYFSINLFRTYINSIRFGFMGFYNTSNQVSYYFILMILYFYYRVFYKGTTNIELVLVLLTSVLIGTKKVYFYLFILFTFHFFKNKLYYKREFYIIMSLLLSFCLFFENNLGLFFQRKFQVFVNLYNKEGFLSMITSKRSGLLKETVNEFVVNSWSIPNYIFGGPKFHIIRTEFGLVDLYLFFGFFGLYYYYYLFKLLFKQTNYNKYYLFVLVSLGVTCFFSSGFLSDANQPLLFIIITGYFIVESRQIQYM